VLEPLLRGTLKSQAAMAPAPITPEWIEEGSPRARCALLSQTDDRAAMTVHWDCTAGKFTWRYDFDETVFILEGGCTLEAEGLPTLVLGPGDSAHFSRGAVVTWTVEHYVRKLGFCKNAAPRPIGLGLRVMRGVWRRIVHPSGSLGGLAPQGEPETVAIAS